MWQAQAKNINWKCVISREQWREAEKIYREGNRESERASNQSKTDVQTGKTLL